MIFLLNFKYTHMYCNVKSIKAYIKRAYPCVYGAYGVCGVTN